MHRGRKRRSFVIFSLVGILLCMVVGYAAFNTKLEIKGTSKVTSNWDIRITNVTNGTPTGSAENTVAPTWDNLTASMEANLYEKGDAMEYDVTIENKGTIDAKLEEITTNLEKANNDAVIITFSGYTKGEKLLKGSSKVIHVKIEYNPNYEGGETSSEVEIDFDYGQNNNETETPENTHLVKYDCTTNGGTACTNNNEYLVKDSNVDLSKKGTKEGWTFVGWNIDKDAETGMKSYQMPNSDTTLYAIYSKSLKVTYEKGSNVTSIGKESDACTIYNNETLCEITLPEITANSGYTSVGWNKTNGATTGTAAGSKLNISSNETYYANAVDKTLPNLNLKTIYNIWGNKEYHIHKYNTGNYVEDAGVDGTWIINGNDPNICFDDTINYKNITGTYVELVEPVNEDLLIEIFYEESGNIYNQSNSRAVTLKAGTTKAMISLPTGNYKSIRFDIGNAATTKGLSYKIKTLGVVAENGQYNDNHVIIQTIGTDAGSGINHYEWYENNEWTTRALTTSNGVGTITFTDDRNLNIQFRAIDNAGNISEVATTPVKIDTKDPTVSISTASTTNSITVVAAASATSGITKYEFSNDNGTTWKDGGTNKTYTFSGLTQNKTYNIQVRVTSTVGKQATTSSSVTTSSITLPTFKESGTTTKTVTITYPSGCGSSLTCNYQKDNGSAVTVTSTTAQVTFTSDGNVIAKVNDGTNTGSSSYSVQVERKLTVGTVRGGTITLNKTSGKVGSAVAITSKASTDFTYKGATAVCANGSKNEISGTSFNIPNCSGTITVYPKYKYKDVYLNDSNNRTRDTEFTMSLWDTNASQPKFWDQQNYPPYYFYYVIEMPVPGGYRGQATSVKSYKINNFSSLTFTYTSNNYSTVNNRTVYIGLVSSRSSWVHSSQFLASKSLPLGNYNSAGFYDQLGTISIDLSGQLNNNNSYYMAWEYLSFGTKTTLNGMVIYFSGTTYSYTNRGV